MTVQGLLEQVEGTLHPTRFDHNFLREHNLLLVPPPPGSADLATLFVCAQPNLVDACAIADAPEAAHWGENFQANAKCQESRDAAGWCRQPLKHQCNDQ